MLGTTYCVFKLRITRQQYIHNFIIKQRHCDRSIIRLQALKLRHVVLLVAHFHLQTRKKRSKSVDTSMYVESFIRHCKIWRIAPLSSSRVCLSCRVEPHPSAAAPRLKTKGRWTLYNMTALPHRSASRRTIALQTRSHYTGEFASRPGDARGM